MSTITSNFGAEFFQSYCSLVAFFLLSKLAFEVIELGYANLEHLIIFYEISSIELLPIILFLSFIFPSSTPQQLIHYYRFFLRRSSKTIPIHPPFLVGDYTQTRLFSMKLRVHVLFLEVDYFSTILPWFGCSLVIAQPFLTPQLKCQSIYRSFFLCAKFNRVSIPKHLMRMQALLKISWPFPYRINCFGSQIEPFIVYGVIFSD